MSGGITRSEATSADQAPRVVRIDVSDADRLYEAECRDEKSPYLSTADSTNPDDDGPQSYQQPA